MKCKGANCKCQAPSGQFALRVHFWRKLFTTGFYPVEGGAANRIGSR